MVSRGAILTCFVSVFSFVRFHVNHDFTPVPQVNFKVKRSNWDGTGDEHARQEEKKDEEVLSLSAFIIIRFDAC